MKTLFLLEDCHLSQNTICWNLKTGKDLLILNNTNNLMYRISVNKEAIAWEHYLQEEYIQNKHSCTYNYVDFDVSVSSIVSKSGVIVVANFTVFSFLDRSIYLLQRPRLFSTWLIVCSCLCLFVSNFPLWAKEWRLLMICKVVGSSVLENTRNKKKVSLVSLILGIITKYTWSWLTSLQNRSSLFPEQNQKIQYKVHSYVMLTLIPYEYEGL